MKMRLLTSLLALCALLLVGCDTYPYKEEIQSTYDYNNPNGDRAICMMSGEVTQSMYPHTIFYMEGQDSKVFSEEAQKAIYNRAKNESLHFFSTLGLLTEEKVGETEGKPLYRYDLTDLGRKYVRFAVRETNFCFGRVVVDSIDDIRDLVNGVGGGKLRRVRFTFHIENVPDWVKNSDALERFGYSKKMATGEPIRGSHIFSVLGHNEFKTMSGESGVYQWILLPDVKPRFKD